MSEVEQIGFLRLVIHIDIWIMDLTNFSTFFMQFLLTCAEQLPHKIPFYGTLGSNIGSPFEVRRFSESSHNVEGDQATPDD
ncbi:nuclear cap-binding protein subunit [Trifolium repens]|nr:nuclear cap-binding protein subunit [Trifolium repens]